jgi:hypothetical protein
MGNQGPVFWDKGHHNMKARLPENSNESTLMFARMDAIFPQKSEKIFQCKEFNCADLFCMSECALEAAIAQWLVRTVTEKV